MTQPVPFWDPRTEADLQSAIDSGLLEETHYLDLKRELAPGKSGNKGIAKDLAAFAIDGGMILVGVDEGDGPAQPPELAPQPLHGMAERVEQIALTSVSEPLRIQCTSIPSSSDPSVGYLAIRIPPSPRAPHMADGKYYGRGDKTNRTLSHEEVLRYHQLLLTERANIKTVVAELLDEIDSSAALIGLIAEPIGLRDELLIELTEDRNWENHVSTILTQADTKMVGPVFPPLTRADGYQRRAEGVAVTTGMPNETRQFNGNGKATELVFHESGRLTLVSEKATYMHIRQVQPEPPAVKAIHEQLIISKTEILVHVAAEVAQWTQYQGSWRFALAVRSVRGGQASLHLDTFRFSSGPEYTADTYTREAEATWLDITTDPRAVVRKLLMPLLRSLDVHRHQRLKWLSDEHA